VTAGDPVDVEQRTMGAVAALLVILVERGCRSISLRLGGEPLGSLPSHSAPSGGRGPA
jgi:hypothetical protein